MSDTIDDHASPPPGNEDKAPVSTADVERMLAEHRAARERAERALETERASRTRLERERDEMAGRVGSEAEQRYQVEMQAVEQALVSLRADDERAGERWAQAMEAGDYKAANLAQRQQTEAAHRISQFSDRKQWLEANRDRLVQPPQTTRERDEYAELVKDIRPQERRWLEARPQFLSDARYRTKVYGASAVAEGEGHERGTPEYFQRMEQILGEAQADDTDEPPAERPARQERIMSADLAPARRTQPGARPANGRQEITLTADEREVADSLYGEPSQPGFIQDPGERYKHYHDNKNRMRASGRL